MISVASWLRKGVAKENPQPREVDEEEEEEEQPVDRRLAALSREVKKSSKGQANSLADGIAELDMENYDDEEEDEEAGALRLFGNGGAGDNCVWNEEDPYIDPDAEDSEEDAEAEDLAIKPTDILLLTARNEDDVSSIEVWVYEDDADEGGEPNLYVHHDIVLPSFPLALAWLDCPPQASEDASQRGNFVAVGTLEPGIEIWDLDVLNELEPVVTLGGPVASSSRSKQGLKKKKKKKKGEQELKEGSHQGSVLGLAWNPEYRNALASCSADHTVKVWDVVQQACQATIEAHEDKVQAVAWNPAEPTTLLTGSFDKTTRLCDMRAPTRGALCWRLPADVECLAWNPHQPQDFVVSTEDGCVRCFDARAAAAGASTSAGTEAEPQALYTLAAHTKATCTLAFNPAAPHLLATGSTDKQLKLWDTTDHQPALVSSTNPRAGAIFTASFCVDAPFLLAAAGSKGKLQVLDLRNDAAIQRRYGRLLQGS